MIGLFPCNFAVPVRAAHFRGLLALVVLMTAAIFAAAQAGQLDPTFANNGIFSNSFNTSPAFATAVALRSDGKIVVGGEIGNSGAIIRLNTNGTLDTSFGSGGVVTIRFRDVQNVTTGLAVQSDGKIVVAGTGLPQGGELDRLNSNGSFDSTFGSNGVVGLGNTPGFLALQTDGKILLTDAVPGSAVREIQRFQTNGQPDTSFGTGGSAALVGPGPITLQADGKILVPTDSFTGGAMVARYTSSGSLDTGFGIAGQAGAVSGLAAVAVQADGHIVSAGTGTSQVSLNGNSFVFGLERFSANGTIDTKFGTRGGVFTNFPNSAGSVANAHVIQPNGDIVAAGSAGIPGTQVASTFALARYLITGKLDTSFGNGGLVTTNFGNNATASITAIALQSDGKIVAVGSDGGGTLIVARYLGQ